MSHRASLLIDSQCQRRDSDVTSCYFAGVLAVGTKRYTSAGISANEYLYERCTFGEGEMLRAFSVRVA